MAILNLEELDCRRIFEDDGLLGTEVNFCGLPIRFERLEYERSLAAICTECNAPICRIPLDMIFSMKPEQVRHEIFYYVRLHRREHAAMMERERFNCVPFCQEKDPRRHEDRHEDRPKQIAQIRKIRIIAKRGKTE